MRLTSDFWVRAYLARLDQAGISAFITSHGDDSAGAVIVKLNTLDGKAAAWQRTLTLEGTRAWQVLVEGTEADVDTALARQKQYDPDIWVVEVEDRAGRTLLDDPGLSD